MTKRLIFIVFMFSLAAESSSGVEVGASRVDLIKEKGDPTSVVESSERSILTFADHSTVVLKDGCVVNVAEVTTTSLPEVREHPAKEVSAPKLDLKRVALALVVTLIAGRLLFSAFFSSSGDFAQTTRANLFPTWTYITRGDWYEVQESKAKMLLWIGFSVGAGLAVYIWSGGSLAPLVELVLKH